MVRIYRGILDTQTDGRIHELAIYVPLLQLSLPSFRGLEIGPTSAGKAMTGMVHSTRG